MIRCYTASVSSSLLNCWLSICCAAIASKYLVCVYVKHSITYSTLSALVYLSPRDPGFLWLVDMIWLCQGLFTIQKFTFSGSIKNAPLIKYLIESLYFNLIRMCPHLMVYISSYNSNLLIYKCQYGILAFFFSLSTFSRFYHILLTSMIRLCWIS